MWLLHNQCFQWDLTKLVGNKAQKHRISVDWRAISGSSICWAWNGKEHSVKKYSHWNLVISSFITFTFSRHYPHMVLKNYLHCMRWLVSFKPGNWAFRISQEGNTHCTFIMPTTNILYHALAFTSHIYIYHFI